MYSPTGKCNHKLKDFPENCQNPVLVQADNKIIACCISRYCWEYNTTTSIWSAIAPAPFPANRQPGVVYQQKVYIIDDERPQVFDPVSKTWSSWPSPPKKSGNAPSMVGWKDTIILLGGSSNRRGIQIFNVTEQTWTARDSSQVPMDLYWSSSITLLDGNVLVIGSDIASYSYSAAIYNPSSNSWKELEKTATNHRGTRVIQLERRIFAIGGVYSLIVEEFHLNGNTWKPVDSKLLIEHKGDHSLLALPARLFSHLPGGCQGVQ